MVPSAFASLVDSFLERGVRGLPHPRLEPRPHRVRRAPRRHQRGRLRAAPRLRPRSGWGSSAPSRMTDLAPAERIDRDLLVSVLRGRELYQPLEMWKRQPNYYLNPGLNGVFSLFLHRLRPERELADAAAKRLEGVPTNIRDGVANLDFSQTPRVYAERAHRSGEGGRALRAGARAGGGQGPVIEAASDRGGREGRKGVRRVRGVSRIEQADRAKGDWAIGEELYSALLREKELLPFGAAELRERGREQHELLSTEANRIAKEIDGSGDWAKTCDRLNKIHAPTPDAMRDEYEEWTERARSFLRDTELVTLPPGEKCSVEPSPPFQRPVLAVASYQRPPAFRDTLHGHFFVPYPPDGTPRGGGAEAARGQLQRGHPDDGGARGVSRSPLASRDGEVQPVACAAHLRHGVLQRGLGAVRRARHARAGLLHRSEAPPLSVRGDDLPRGAHRRRHEPAHGRDDLRRSGALHGREGEPHRAERARRGRPLLQLADAGVELPHRDARDHRHPHALARPARQVGSPRAARVPRRHHDGRDASDLARGESDRDVPP